MRRWLHLTRSSVRMLAAALLCLCLLGAGGGDVTQGIIFVGGFLLALVGQGWAGPCRETSTARWTTASNSTVTPAGRSRSSNSGRSGSPWPV